MFKDNLFDLFKEVVEQCVIGVDQLCVMFDDEVCVLLFGVCVYDYIYVFVICNLCEWMCQKDEFDCDICVDVVFVDVDLCLSYWL